FGPEPWDWFWQNIPLRHLQEGALRSLWHLHAQPPLWNALGAVLLEVFGDAQLLVLQGLQIVLGAGTVTLVALLVRSLTGSRRLSLGAGLAMAVHPALFLYEAYALYTILGMFLVTLGAYLLVLASRRGNASFALGFIAVIVALTLTRSLFHVILLAAAVPLALRAGGGFGRRQWIVAALLCLVPLAWYGKNRAQAGFFGGSSWYGMGLWRVALYGQSPARLDSLYREGRFSDVVTRTPFSIPSEYRAMGFDATSTVPLLSDDNLHNVNVPAISREYNQAARTLILSSPGRYLRTVLVAYGNFSAPSSEFTHLGNNKPRLGWIGSLDRWVLLRPAFQALEVRFGLGFTGSLYTLLFPAVLMSHLWLVLRARRMRGHTADPRHPAVLYMAGMVGYTVVIGCAMELGENVRFKALVEPVLLVLVLTVARTLLRSAAGADAEAEAHHGPEAEIRGGLG
ncbi:MAG: hypothetical protein OEZ37_13320, partial [Gemmatimonadota bacterium]|nr:hypothetical protein [Gemmatimonadota bacterium]